jgi:hypothetical protein
MIGVVLVVIAIGGLYNSIRHHDTSTIGFTLLLLFVAALGLYSATH